MKIATTIGEMYPFTATPAEAIAAYEGTGFRYLDYSFYEVVSMNTMLSVASTNMNNIASI